MEIQEQNKLRFLGVEFINVNFNSYSKVTKDSPPIDVNIEPRVFLPKEEINKFYILMNVGVTITDFFELSLLAVGKFEVVGEIIEEKSRNSFLNANAPAIMFPYVRAFISTFTSNLGDVTGRVMIPTQFFKGTLSEVDQSASEGLISERIN